MIENAINPIVLSDSDAPAPVIVARTEEEVVPVVLARTKAGTQTFSQSDWKEENVNSLAYIKNKPTIPSDSLQITYESPEATTHNVANVEAALDKLFRLVNYTEFKIESFTKADGVYDYKYGDTIDKITFRWKTNIEPLSIVIKTDGKSLGEINKTAVSFEKDFSSNTIKSNTTFILECTYTDKNGDTQTATKSLSLNFYYPLYYWTAAEDANDVLTGNYKLIKGNTIELDATPNSQYIYIAFPTDKDSSKSPTFYLGGFDTDFEPHEDNVSVGLDKNYVIYRNKQKIGSGSVVKTKIIFNN